MENTSGIDIMFRNAAWTVFAVCFVGICDCRIFGQEADLQKFRLELSAAVLGSATPIGDGSGSFVGVAVVSPGEAWSPTSAEDEANDRNPWGTSPLSLQFNYPVTVVGGVPSIQRQQRLEKLWQRVLSGSVPDFSDSNSSLNSLLFKKSDRVDDARMLNAVRLPSDAYLRYQEYKSAWSVLELATDDKDSWRFHPRFSAFVSLKDARSQLMGEWMQYGYKTEIESSIEEFNRQKLTGGWKSWLNASDSFRTNTIDGITGVPASRTWFFPTESEWHTMRSWASYTFTSSGGGKITCQIAKVKIMRPWLDLSLLTDPHFKLRPDSGLEVMSDGIVASADEFAKGQMPNLVEELLLVRRIHASGAISGHPLARFEYPEAINLIAYVIRSVPKTSSKVP